MGTRAHPPLPQGAATLDERDEDAIGPAVVSQDVRSVQEGKRGEDALSQLDGRAARGATGGEAAVERVAEAKHDSVAECVLSREIVLWCVCVESARRRALMRCTTRARECRPALHGIFVLDGSLRVNKDVGNRCDDG